MEVHSRSVWASEISCPIGDGLRAWTFNPIFTGELGASDEPAARVESPDVL